MSIAFVLGNGVSRKDISLTALSQCGRIYGCNALHREHTPDVLVSTDRPIAEHIQHSGYSAIHRFYTRRPLPNLGAQLIPKPYFGFSSGPVAVGLAAVDGHRRIYLLGFDLGPTANKTINNIYAGTEFYKPITASPTYTGNWIRQLTRIMNDHQQTRFVRVMGDTTAPIAEFDSVNNLTHLDLATFVDRINKQKDL
jgi:hypothetical protein